MNHPDLCLNVVNQQMHAECKSNTKCVKGECALWNKFDSYPAYDVDLFVQLFAVHRCIRYELDLHLRARKNPENR